MEYNTSSSNLLLPLLAIHTWLCERFTMSSDQVPPSTTYCTFPLDGDQLHGGQLHINYLDSFVTSWVTPPIAQEPCDLSLCFLEQDVSNQGWQASKMIQTWHSPSLGIF